MSAKEMFEKLGYEPRLIHDSMFATKSYIQYSSRNIIYFDYDKRIDVGNCMITMELLQAINKQIEELGWNNENI